MLYRYKLGQKAVEITKNIYCEKKGAVNPSKQIVQEILLRLQEP